MFDPKISAHRFFLMLSIVAIAACDLPRV
ncbi:MAG: hypothetical protein RI932_1217, partial [Pseudomonadota bacterium]